MDLRSTQFDGPARQRGIGILAPFDLALDRELWRWVPHEVSLHMARTPYEQMPMSSVQMGYLLGNNDQLAAATRDVHVVQPEVVAYLCSSGSFVGGAVAERGLCKAIRDAGAPEAVTTSGALLEAVRALGLRKVSVVTPYFAELTVRLHEFLAEADVRTVASEHLGLDGEIWKVGYRDVVEHVLRADRPEAEAVFVSCTNMPTYDVIAPLEETLGKPVLTANQLTMWACLRRMRLPAVGPGRWLPDLP